MFSQEAKDLWRLDILDIILENVTKEAHQTKVKALFQETKIDDKDRYEFFCPGRKIIHLYKTIEI